MEVADGTGRDTTRATQTSIRSTADQPTLQTVVAKENVHAKQILGLTMSSRLIHHPLLTRNPPIAMMPTAATSTFKLVLGIASKEA